MTVKPVSWCKPGSAAGLAAAEAFATGQLKDYNGKRNDPNAGAQSELSPYLHFGQLSAQATSRRISRHRGSRSRQDPLGEYLGGPRQAPSRRVSTWRSARRSSSARIGSGTPSRRRRSSRSPSCAISAISRRYELGASISSIPGITVSGISRRYLAGAPGARRQLLHVPAELRLAQRCADLGLSRRISTCIGGPYLI